MKTTQEERDAFRSMVDEAEGDVVVVIGDHLHIKPQLGVSIFMQLLDDADRCAELEAGIRNCICPTCHGAGMVNDEHECGDCDGNGYNYQNGYTGAQLQDLLGDE